MLLRRLWARIYRLLHPPHPDEAVIERRMEQFVGVEVRTAPYKLERRHVHGELVIWQADEQSKKH